MRSLTYFLIGALAGATTALLLTPKKGEDLRNDIREILIRKGIIKNVSEEEIVEQIVAEIQAEHK